MASSYQELDGWQRARLMQLLNENATSGTPSMDDIAKEFHVTPATIHDWAKQAVDEAMNPSDTAFSYDSDDEDSGENLTKFDRFLDANPPERNYEPLSAGFKVRLGAVVGISIVLILGFLFVRPAIQSRNAESVQKQTKVTEVASKSNEKATQKATEVKNVETPKPTATPKITAGSAIINLKQAKVEIDYGSKYDPTTNVNYVQDNQGRVVNYAKDRKNGKGWFYVTSGVDSSKSGTQKVTVEAYYNDIKAASKTFDVVVKPKPTPVPTPTPAPVQRQRTVQPAQSQPVQQPVQPSNQQPAEDDGNVDLSKFGDGSSSYDGHSYD